MGRLPRSPPRRRAAKSKVGRYFRPAVPLFRAARLGLPVASRGSWPAVPGLPSGRPVAERSAARPAAFRGMSGRWPTVSVVCPRPPPAGLIAAELPLSPTMTGHSEPSRVGPGRGWGWGRVYDLMLGEDAGQVTPESCRAAAGRGGQGGAGGVV